MTSDQSSSAHISAASVSWEEKRRHPRIEICWKACLEKPEGPEEVQLKDISLGGAFVVCPNPLPLTEKFRIFVDPPEQTPLELNAEVVWSNANVPEDKIISRGMGIRFINNPDEIRSRLNDVITSFFESES